MKTSLIAALAACFLSACVIITGPPKNKPFSDTKDLAQLSGTYSNLGTSGRYLSVQLWARGLGPFYFTKADVPHSTAKSIRIKVSGPVVSFEAIADNCVISSRAWTEGKHFQISEGRMILRDELGSGGQVGLGLDYAKEELGIDTNGDGKIRYRGGMAVLLFLMIPVAGYERRDFRFERVADPGDLPSCDRSLAPPED